MSIPPDVVTLADYERHFRSRCDPATVAYVAGAAADGLTQSANRAAFDRTRLLPRVLVGMEGATARTTLLGVEMPFPVLLAPVAYHRLVHPEGELATVAGAGHAGAWMTVSTQASVALEAIAARASAPLWFQLYLQPTEAATLRLVRRAEAAGYRALVVTVDAPLNGIRNAEARAGFRLPPDVRAVNLDGLPPQPSAVARGHSPVFEGLLAGAPTWATLARLRDATALPILLKGILHPDDAERAVAAGIDAIVVSNHGGRVLDTVPATLDALPGVVRRVGDRVPVLLDGGVRRGTDILKGLALGARAVLVGQPQLHALAVGGAAGVAHLLAILRVELEAAMALCGVPTLDGLDRGLLFDAPRTGDRSSAPGW